MPTRPSHLIEVTAPSRLHFGMLSFGRTEGRQFGGAGVMISRPEVRVRLTAAERLEATGPLRDRALHFARSFAAFHRLATEPPCHIEVVASPRPHTGLGVGTALGMAVGAGLNRLLAHPPTSVAELARSVGRGKRSAVGVYGFDQGGLIVEEGKLSDEDLSPLADRVELPSQWRFVLVTPGDHVGLSGEAEIDAFGRLPPVPAAVTRQLRGVLTEVLLPAARRGDFPQFSEGLYQFGHTAGECFASQQHGAYATPRLAELVDHILSLGVRGVGQSSWGPTLFALLPEPSAAEDFVATLRSHTLANDCELTISPPNNLGAVIT